jgi:hypothetical protein
MFIARLFCQADRHPRQLEANNEVSHEAFKRANKSGRECFTHRRGVGADLQDWHIEAEGLATRRRRRDHHVAARLHVHKCMS